MKTNHENLDVFIFGAQGAGKSAAARKMVADYIETHDAPKGCSILVTPEVFDNHIDGLANYIKRSEARVAIFDGVINNRNELNRAIATVRHLRSYVDYPVLSLYCIQGESSNYITYAADGNMY